jgi:uracil-DNA glycosylase
VVPGRPRAPKQAALDLGEAESSRLLRWAPQEWAVAPGWREVVDTFLASTAGLQLADTIRQRLAQGAIIYPPRPLRALELTPLHEVRAVVVGQDPYHGPGQAEGLAFSVAPGVKMPPSLRNILKELGGRPPQAGGSGSLLPWARAGALLLNTSLTVEEGLAASHARKGWEVLTDALLQRVAETASPCVYLLWGAHAQAKAGMIRATASAHGRDALVLVANHPSPLSANRPPQPFIGCGHFALADDWLRARGGASPFQPL